MESPVSPQPPTEPTTRMCVSCGRRIDFASNVCPYCGHDYRGLSYATAPQKRTAMPVIGGIMILIAGLLAIGMGVLYLALDVNQLENTGVTLPPGVTLEEVRNILVVCGAVLLIFGIIAILGGVFAIQRKYFAFAVFGGIFGMIGIGFFFGALLALIGLILVAVSRHEFQ